MRGRNLVARLAAQSPRTRTAHTPSVHESRIRHAHKKKQSSGGARKTLCTNQKQSTRAARGETVLRASCCARAARTVTRSARTSGVTRTARKTIARPVERAIAPMRAIICATRNAKQGAQAARTACRSGLRETRTSEPSGAMAEHAERMGPCVRISDRALRRYPAANERHRAA